MLSEVRVWGSLPVVVTYHGTEVAGWSSWARVPAVRAQKHMNAAQLPFCLFRPGSQPRGWHCLLNLPPLTWSREFFITCPENCFQEDSVQVCFETGSHCVPLARPELTMQTRLTSWRSPVLCLLSAWLHGHSEPHQVDEINHHMHHHNP